jgi:transcriptional regulator with XRE-family HTH domain
MSLIKPSKNIPIAAYDQDELAVDVGMNIFKARTRIGWTQEKLAEELNTFQSSVSRVENGNALPSLNFLLKIAKALGTGVVAPTFASLLSIPSPITPDQVIATNESSSYSSYESFSYSSLTHNSESRGIHYVKNVKTS